MALLGGNKKEEFKSINDSFSRIKEDMNKRIQEINGLKHYVESIERRQEQKIEELSRSIEKIRDEFWELKNSLHKEMSEIKELLKSNSNTRNNDQINTLAIKKPLTNSEFEKLKTGLMQELLQLILGNRIVNNTGTAFSNLSHNNINPLEREILKKVEKNKKEIIKNKILELLAIRDMKVSEIKEIIVDQQKYCSKASFYRYFNELKKQERLTEVNLNNKIIVSARINR